MNPQAINDAYKLFASKGYTGSQDEFVSLISSNQNAFNDAFTLFSSKGYSGGEDGFKSLMGVTQDTPSVKKKDEQVSIGVEEDTDLLVPSEKERDFLSEQLLEQERIEAEDPFIGTLLSDTPTDAFEQSAESITPELIGREEEFTVPKLNYQFNDYGFTFEETGIGDAMSVTAMNGNKIRVDLDPFTGKGERDEAAKLRKFMDDNRGESERIAKQNKLIRSNIKKVATQEQLDNTISTFNNQTKELREDQKFFVQAKLESDKIYEDNFKDITSEQIANDPALKNAYNSWLEGRKAMEMAYNDLVTKEEGIIEKGAELDRIASEYTGMKAKQGTWSGGIIDGLMRGFGKTAAATVSMAATTGVELGIGENVEKKQERIIDEAIEYLETEGGDLDMEELRSNMSGMTMDELEDYLTDIPTNQIKPKTQSRMSSIGQERPDEFITLFDYADDKRKDLTKKAIKYYDNDYDAAKEGRQINEYSVTATDALAPKGIVDEIRTTIVENLGSKNTTEQWADLRKQGFWGGAILGVTESIPAMIGGAGKIGSTQRAVQMIAQATDAIDDEMSRNPEFDNVSEKEKFYVKAPIGVAVGVLENIGFRNVISQKGLVTNVLGKALGKSTSRTTAKQFGDFVREDVKSMMGRGLLTLTGAGLAEFETGAAQELATLSIKEIYNQSKGKDMFQTPDTWIDWAADIAYAGAQEAVGGFILGVPNAVSNAVYTKDMSRVSDDMFKVFEAMSKDPEYKRMQEARLDAKVLSGEMTKEDADKEKAQINQVEGLLNTIPENLTTESKKKALELVAEKQELTREKANKEPELVKKIDGRIEKINEELRGIEEKNISIQQEAETQAQEKLEAEKVGIGVVGDTQVTETAPVEETQEQKDIAQMFEGEIAEAQAVSDNLAINERGKVEGRTTQDNSRIADVVNKAKRAATAISTVLPQTKIVLHESKDEFKRFTGKTGRGLFDPQTNTIHINLTDATKTTVPHEVFHAVLLNKIGTDTELQGVVKDMVMSVAKVVKKGTELSNKLDEFVSAYESEGDAIINEERLAELMALMSTDYGMLSKPQKNVVLDFIRKVASKFGIELGDTFGQKDSDVIDLLNTMARKTQVGEQITDADLEIFSTEQGEGGLVGSFTFPPREQVEVTEAPSTKDDPRRFIRELVEDKDIREFEGQKFITNMYDYTTAGETDMGNGLMANFVGGINYAPFYMSRRGLGIGDVSNLAAFQGKDKAESFIRNVEVGGVNLFAPHSGTLDKSWMFQQHIFAELTDLVLDNGIVNNEELINYFSGRLDSKAGKKAFATFQRNYEKKFGEKIDSLDRFKENPKELVSLLGIDDNMSLEMRKSFNDSLSSLKPFQEAIGIKNKTEFYGKIIDPTNVGVTGGEIMGVIKFDPNALSIRKTTPNDIDHHPSFSWTVDAKIEGFYQPTLFYKSYDLTNSYTKYNKDGSSISRKVEGEAEKFIKANVLSSAGAIPKVTEPIAVPEPTIRKAREQKSMNEIIQESRDAGFKEDVIRDLLVRRLGMKARVVDNALAKFTDLFREFGTMPKSFGDMDGGLVASKKLFKKLQAFHRKEVRNNKRRVERNRISQQEIMDKTIDYMESLPEFKAEGDTYVRGGKTITRQGYSTQQARMISDLQKMVNVRPTENVRQKVRDARRLIAEKKRQKNQLKRIKYELRKLMRKTLPESLYTKKEALDLMQKIVDADTSTIDNIVEEVASFVISKNNQILKSKIDTLLAKDTTKVEYGRRKGKRVSVRVKETIDLIKANLLNDKSTSEEIDAKNAQLSVEFNKLSEIPNKTEEQMLKMTALKTAIEYNNALQMDNSDSSKTDTLDFILDTLQSLEDAGRSEFQAEIEEQQAMYQSDFAVAYEEIMQKTIDFSDPNKAKEQLDETQRDLENKKAAKTVEKKIRSILNNISQRLRIGIFTSQEALDGLIDLISRSAGEMFGGKLQEIVTDSIDASSRMYKARKMYVESLVANKLEEIYGKKWQKATRKNNVAKVNMFGGQQVTASQNQMYYLYNQYKDEANHAAFQKMYGKDYAQVMSDMEAALDPKVKAFADWQVNEFFPSLYDHYNSVYRKIYKTNMPQNEKYAGRIYREGVEPEPLDLLGNNSVFNTAVGAASTKARVANNNKIQKMNGNDALFAYIKDMEYFAAYAENVRRIDKMFNNEYISSAIKSIHGNGTYSLIKDSIQKIANNGTRNPLLSQIVNSMNDVFILSRLALSPLITIKQLTSIPTYANDIGILNWLKYSGMNLAKLRKTYKEVAENSVYMQDRKRTPITQAIEAYGNASLTQRNNIIPSNVRDTIIKVMMYNVKVGDAAAIYIGGMPNYLYYKDQYKKSNPSATEQEAIDYAVVKFEKDTKRTQQSSDLQDKDFLQTNNPVLRAMNMFMTTPKQYLRKEIQAMRNLYRKMKAFDRKAGKGTVTENLRTFAMYHFFMPMLFQYISMGLPGLLRGWREDDEKDLFRAAVLGNLNAIFVLGEIGQWVSDAYAGKPYAAEQVKSMGILNQAQRMTRLYLRAERTKDPEKREANFKKFYLESMMITGLPAPTLKKFAENYSKIGEGDDIGRDIMRLLNYSDYQQVGSKKTKGKDPATLQELNEQYEKEQSKVRRQSKGLQNDGGYVSPSRRKSRGKSSGGYVPPSRRK